MISVLTQLGYVAAYALCGWLADAVFTPMLMEDGILAGRVGQWLGTGEGRGIGFMLVIAGIAMASLMFMLGSGLRREAYEATGGHRDEVAAHKK